jgi:hypothetical protein
MLADPMLTVPLLGVVADPIVVDTVEVIAQMKSDRWWFQLS